LIQQGAQALERSRLYEQERRARAEAEAAELRLGFLLDASTVLASSLDYPATLEGVGRVAVSAIADVCLMDMLLEDGSIERMVAVHADPTKQPLADDLKEFAPDPTGPHPAVRVMRTGRPEIIPEMSEEFLRATTRDEEHHRITRELDFQSYMCVPLIARGRNLGTITLVRTQGSRPYDDDDLALAEELAVRAALATDNARLYRERDRWARALQSALLPPEIPDIPGVDVAARYRPAGEGNEIGGDFFDIFWTKLGWALVVGDVQGKGPDAAAIMGLIRHSVRAAATQDPSPARVLHVVNDALRRQDGDDRFATVSFVRLEAAGAGVRLTACSAGHPLPLIVQRDGTLRGAGEPGTLLGVFAEPQLQDRSSALSPGDTVVMYTDGVTERRSGSALFGEQRLQTLLSSLAGSTAAEIADRIEREVQGFGPEEPKDDIAILVVRIADWGVAGEPPRQG
jgi:serine phosphatase RsbU (regulator of sigma subunit)